MLPFLLAAALAAPRIPTWSSEFDAVLVADPGRAPTVFVADAATSAPLTVGSVRARLVPSPGEATEVDAVADGAGGWTLPDPLAAGHWSGTLTVLTDTRSDALGLPAWEVGPEAAEPGGPGPRGGATWSVVLAVGAVSAVLGAGLGLAVGRRRLGAAVGVVAIVATLASHRDVSAHGDEVHEGIVPTASADGDLALELDRQFLLGLRTERVATDALAPRARASGILTPSVSGRAVVRAVSAGTLRLADGIRPGATVRRGDVLGTIDEQLDATGRLALSVAQADARLRVDEARAALALAVLDVDNAAQLDTLVSGRDLAERRQRRDVAHRALAEAEAALAAAGRSTTLQAPLDGTIASLTPRAGDAVASGEVVLTLTAPGALWAELRLPERWAGLVVPGSDARIRRDAIADDWRVATVLAAAAESDPNTGTFATTLQVDDVDGAWLPGMAVTADVAVGPPTSGVSVPESAVVYAGGVPVVFVKTAPERFSVRPVTLGAAAGGRRLVLTGVESGDRVVTVGTWALRALAGR